MEWESKASPLRWMEKQAEGSLSYKYGESEAILQ